MILYQYYNLKLLYNAENQYNEEEKQETKIPHSQSKLFHNPIGKYDGDAMVFNVTFNNISVIWWWSVLLVEENGVLGETTDLPLSHNVVSSTPRHEQDLNSQL